MSGVLQHRGFARLLTGQVVSMIGDWLTYVAVGVLAIHDGGMLGVLGLLLAHTLPRLLVAAHAGRLADRIDRRTVLVLGSLARGLAVLGMAVAAGFSAYGWVQGLLVLRMALGAYVDAAAGAAVPRLVPSASLASAHALLGVTWSVVFTLGVAVGGALTAVVGPQGVLLLDALSFVAAALVFAGLPSLRPRRVRRGDGAGAGGRASGLSSGSGSGWAPVWSRLSGDRALRTAALSKLPVMVANGGAFVLAHAVAAGQQTETAVALTLGGLHLLRALGTAFGPVLWIRAAALRGTARGLTVATGVTFGGVLLFACASSALLQGVGALVWGIGVGSHWSTADTRVQQLSPDPLRGRLSAVDLSAHTIGQGLGGVLGTLGLMVMLTPATAMVAMVVPTAAIAWVGIHGRPQRPTRRGWR